ncbi:hypothetical protein BH23ACT9_BH23ACT9_37010 [soil metagenome]
MARGHPPRRPAGSGMAVRRYGRCMDPTEVIDPDEDPRPRAGRRRRSDVPADVREIPLRDGSRIWVRTIRTEDREQLEQGLQGLSARSRYMRFHTHVDRLTSSQLAYLTDVEHHDHDALVAFDPDLPDVPGVAVARYIRLQETPEIAEAAITVIDSHQGRGIGTTLVALLEQIAHPRGITRFRNYVLAENTAMMEIFRQLDGDIVQEGPGLYRVDVPVLGPEDQQPDTPAGQWVASIGRQRTEQQNDWAYPLVWLLRRLGEVAEAPRLLKKPRSSTGADADANPEVGPAS